MQEKDQEVARPEDPLTNRERRVLETIELVTKQMAAAVACCSRDFQYIWANQGYADLLQRPLHEIVGRPCMDVLGKEAFEALRPRLERVLAGEKFSYEGEVNYNSIGRRWIAATHTPTFDANGKVNGWVAVVTDITERKRAEEALRKSDERFRLAAKTGKMFAYEWNVATDVIERSGESGQILEIDEAAPFTGEQAISKVHPQDSDRLKAAVAQLSPKNPFLLVRYRTVQADGTVIWVERNSRAYFDDQGRMLRVVGMVTDISERKLAEDKLQEYERAVEGLDEMIAVIDREFRFLLANNKFLKMRNMTREQVVGRFAREVLDQGVFESVIKERMDECFQGEAVRYEIKYTYPELGERDVLVSYFPIEAATGVDRLACIVQDITERKLAEETLSTVSQKLIEAQEHERSRLARELHDDINQRMALLVASLNRMKKNFPSSAAQFGQQIEELSEEIGDVAKDVQAMSHRLHSPKLELLGLAAAAQSLCREFSELQHVEIEYRSGNVPKELPPDISLSLFRILQEALQNAAKHSGSRYFQVSLMGGANEIELTVCDSGSGFELEEAIKGRGLGLTSMKERIKLVGGELSIESELQHGTTLHARVPLNLKRKSVGAAD